MMSKTISMFLKTISMFLKRLTDRQVDLLTYSPPHNGSITVGMSCNFIRHDDDEAKSFANQQNQRLLAK